MSMKKLSSTMEDYLEAIFNLEKDLKAVRIKDIAEKMMVKLPTVTSMMGTLAQRGLVNHEKYEYVELTKKGKRIAKDVYRRHVIFRDFLMGILNIDAKTAEEDACRMEHVVSHVTLERFVKFMEFVETCPRGGFDWLRHFDEYRQCDRVDADRECLERMKSFVKGYNARIKELESKTE
ncbi:MAG: metal-dependent transcriptional regulator [Thermodesulfobacteriota bacterium]|nr:metal-dependent transcriptional regulator [Thermodesulfobacteriota bacterium]